MTIRCIDLRVREAGRPDRSRRRPPTPVLAAARPTPARPTSCSWPTRSRSRASGTAVGSRGGASRSPTRVRRCGLARRCAGGCGRGRPPATATWSDWATVRARRPRPGRVGGDHDHRGGGDAGRALRPDGRGARRRRRAPGSASPPTASSSRRSTAPRSATRCWPPGGRATTDRLAVRTHDVTGHLAPGPRAEVALTVAPGVVQRPPRLRRRHPGLRHPRRCLRPARAPTRRRRRSRSSAPTTRGRRPPRRYLLAELYDGETFDARLPAAGAPADVTPVEGFDHAVLCTPGRWPPVRRTEVAPRRSTRNGAILDFGQNLVGWLRITLRGVPAGTEVVLRHAEVLDADGALFTAPLRTARATDTYIAAGSAEETYEPRFTFHGFRYAEITGVDLDEVEVEAVVVHSDLDRIGTFACSDPLLEQLHRNVVWGLRGNFVSLPTDCPQRDERLGWTGDAQVFAPDRVVPLRLRGLLAELAGRPGRRPGRRTVACPNVVPGLDFAIGPAAGWGDAAVVDPLDHLRRRRRRRRPPPGAAVDARDGWTTCAPGSTTTTGGSQDFQFGDWLDPDAPTDKPWEAKARFDLVATAYAARSATLLARAAAVVGDDDDRARRRRARRHGAVRVVGALRRGGGRRRRPAPPWPSPSTSRPTDGPRRARRRARHAGGRGGRPPRHRLPRHPDPAPGAHRHRPPRRRLRRPAPADLTRRGCTRCSPGPRRSGSDGTPCALTAPSSSRAWAAGSSGSMVSFNHYAYGAVAEWLHTTVAGLRPDPADPGYHHVLIEPRPGGGLTHASASLESPLRTDPRRLAARRRRHAAPRGGAAAEHLGDRHPAGAGARAPWIGPTPALTLSPPAARVPRMASSGSWKCQWCPSRSSAS